MRDMQRSLRRNVAWMEKLLARLERSVESQADLLRPDVIALSRRLDRVALRLMRQGYVRTPGSFEPSVPSAQEDRPGS